MKDNDVIVTTRTIRKLLEGEKFFISYFQREYRWQGAHVRELIDDLERKFSDYYESGHKRTDVKKYGHYFLGSIIISVSDDSEKSIVDGQQRLTSLTLLLIYIRHQIKNEVQRGQIGNLIFSETYNEPSLNLDVPERNTCMEALFKRETEKFDEHTQRESVVNILERYRDIQHYLPEKLGYEKLPCFADWLMNNVYFVEITSHSDNDAYTIFETMNDRGLTLKPTDKLRGYLITSIENHDLRESAIEVWGGSIRNLEDNANDMLVSKGIGLFISNWLDSKFCETYPPKELLGNPYSWLNEGIVGLKAEGDDDLSRVYRDFYRWVRDNEKHLGLKDDDSFAQFIDEFAFYSRWYRRIFEACKKPTEGLEAIYLTWGGKIWVDHPEYALMFAPLCSGEREEESLRKIRIVAGYVDIVISRYGWGGINGIADANKDGNSILRLIREIRNKSAEDLVEILIDRLGKDNEVFTKDQVPLLYSGDLRQVHRILARITDFVEMSIGEPSNYARYMAGKGTNRYEIEHIWANHPERYSDEFSDPSEFAVYRNRIGGLLLLPRSSNASLSDMSYEDKLGHYLKENCNWLAKSLHPQAYVRNPKFTVFRKKSGLPFKEHLEFKKADLDARQELYRQISEKIWDPENLRLELEN